MNGSSSSLFGRARSKGGGGNSAAAATTAAAAAASAAMLAPWHLTLQWLSWCSGLLLSALGWLGVTPAGFVEQAKVRELRMLIEHMHIREDQYRQALKDMQEAVGDLEGDKKKALRSLKKTRLEMDMLAEQLAQAQHGDARLHGPDGHHSGLAAAAASRLLGDKQQQEATSRMGLHMSVAVLIAAVWWFYLQDFPAIQRKLVFTLLFPLCWGYLTSILHKRSPSYPPTLLLYCACWFLAGFVIAHKFMA